MRTFDVEQIKCHGLALAKPHTGPYETTVLKAPGKGSRVEHVKLAHISGDQWLVHPGTVLTPAQMFATRVEEETLTSSKKKQNPVMSHMEPIPQCELRSKLFAFACLQAELTRAKEEGRLVNTEVAHASFDKAAFQIAPRIPKQVFVLWSATTREGLQEHRATEVMFSSLYKGRL
jgi:hypothetical protein